MGCHKKWKNVIKSSSYVPKLVRGHNKAKKKFESKLKFSLFEICWKWCFGGKRREIKPFSPPGGIKIYRYVHDLHQSSSKFFWWLKILWIRIRKICRHSQEKILKNERFLTSSKGTLGGKKHGFYGPFSIKKIPNFEKKLLF